MPTQEGEINYVIYCTDAELLKKATGELTNDGYWSRWPRRKNEEGVPKLIFHGPVTACVPRQLCVGAADALQRSQESYSLSRVSKTKRWID